MRKTFSMKYLPFILLVVLIACNTPKKAQEEGPNKFRSEVVRSKGDKKELFEKGVLWAVNNFQDPQDAIEVANKDIGLIVGKGSVDIDPTGSGIKETIHESQAGYVQFTYHLRIKDRRFKYELYGLSHKAKKAGGKLSHKEPDCRWHAMSKGTWQSIKDKAHEKLDRVAKTLKALMKGESKAKW